MKVIKNLQKYPKGRYKKERAEVSLEDSTGAKDSAAQAHSSTQVHAIKFSSLSVLPT